jgi:hypothetical protein
MTITQDGKERVRYGEPGELHDEVIEVRRSGAKDGWIIIEDRESGEFIHVPARIAKQLGRAVARFQPKA